MKNKLLLLGRSVKELFSHNIGMKLLSLLFAVLLWSYVIYSNPSITSDKMLTSIDVNTTGLTVLTSRNLALLTDITKISPVNVRVEVSQSNYSSVTSENVRVELDLTSIRQTGKQTVKLRGSSSVGRVTQIWPESVELVVEDMDQRYTPVQVELVGKSDKYWYSAFTPNPAYITFGGPASIMAQVRAAQVICDVGGITSTFIRGEPYILVDKTGKEINSTTLSKTTSSVSVTVEVYPAKYLSITKNINELVMGDLPEGYEVESVVVQPEAIQVAGTQALLEGMTGLTIEPVDVTGAKQTVTAIRKVNLLGDLKHKSSEQVMVTVNIREKERVARFSDIPVTVSGKSDATEATLGTSKVEIRATGPYSDIQSLSTLKKSDFTASVDVSNLGVGEYDLPVQAIVDNYPEVSFVADPGTIRVYISEPD